MSILANVTIEVGLMAVAMNYKINLMLTTEGEQIELTLNYTEVFPVGKHVWIL